MSEQHKQQQEPSMEEILTSIRRIIADEEGEDGIATRDRSAAGSDQGRRSGGAGDDAEADDVLELTHSLGEDGEIVDLNADERDAERDDGDEVDRPVVNEPVADDPPAVAAEPPAEATGAVDKPAEPEADDEVALAPAPEEERPAAAAANQQEDHRHVQQKTADAHAIMSGRTAETISGSFAKLTHALAPDEIEASRARSDGKTVEEFVEDMIRPALSDWLDKNLPELVERLVQQEIKKIARRAELL